MTETVKVFKNTTGTPIVPGDMDAAIDYTLLTTSSSETVVIKDVEIVVSGEGRARVTPTLDLDGYTAATGAAEALSVDGSLIMGPSSTLKFKATPASGYVAPASGGNNYFKGMAFFEGSSGRQFLSGDGSTTGMNPVKQTSGGHACDDATGAIVKGTLHGGSASGTRFYYKLYSNNIIKYNEAGTNVHNWTHGSTGYSICNDGTYIYRAQNGGTNTIWRTKMSDQTTSTLSTSPSYYGPQANQGACLHHHKGKLYSREYGGSTNLYIIDLATLAVTVKSSSDFSTGSYCDGGFATTTKDGTNYIVEAGDGAWTYYNIDTDSITRNTGGTTQSSTEYAQGGAEVAPGIGIIFGEQSDRATTIDMNSKTFTTSSNSTHGYTTDYTYGNRFGFAGILASVSDPTLQEFEFEALVSGVEIT